ncbi:MAG TPA: hypothetical protein VMX33_03840 [bacterium]|nr:hypothetical protein [bacterium]
MKRSVWFAVAFFAMALVPSWSLDIEAAAGRFGVAIIFNGSGVAGTSNQVVNTIGGSMALAIRKGYFLDLQPTLDLYWTNYEWAADQAVPTQVEHGDSNNAFVVGVILSVPVTATMHFTDRIGGSASIGPAFVMRAAFANDDTDPAVMASNLASMVSYFWSAGRWFYPTASVRFEVYLQQNFTFAFGARGFLQLANAWTSSPDFFDGSILQITMAMLIGLQ